MNTADVKSLIKARGWTYVCHQSRSDWYICGIFDLPENPEPGMYYAGLARYEAETSEEAIRCAYLVAIGEMKPWRPPEYQPCN